MSSNNDISINENKLQEIKDLQMLLQKEKVEYVKNSTFLDIIVESSYKLNKSLGEKIKDIVLRGEISHLLPNDLLGEFNTLELTYEEKNELKISLERTIIAKGNLFLKELNEISDNNVHSLEELLEKIKFDPKEEQDILLSTQKQIIVQQKLYIENLLKLGEKLQELVDIKITTATVYAEQKTAENVAECQKSNLKNKILREQSRLRIFEEIPLSMNAYRKALKNLKEQQDEFKREIEKIRKDLDNYKILIRNEEYQEILQDYKRYNNGIQKKLWVLGKIKNLK